MKARSSALGEKFITTLLLTGLASTPALVAQQTAAPSSKNSGGSSKQPGIRAAFNPGLKDKDGKVVQAISDHKNNPDEENGPHMTDKGLADKALANQGKLAVEGKGKPAPRVLPKPPSGGATPSRAAVEQAKNTWKLAEAEREQKNKPGVKIEGEVQDAAKGAQSDPDFVGVNDTGTEPPDVAMAVGPNQIVSAANFVVNTADKNGNLLGSQSFSSFYSPLGGFASWFIFDPIVTYDPYIQRFWVVATAENDATNGSVILIALSAGPDATSGFFFWWVDFTVDGSNASSNWCDYPHFGWDTRAIYITCNQFAFPSSSNSFQYAKIRKMDKSQFLNFTCCSWWDHWDLREGFLNLSHSFTVQPATMRNAFDSDGEFLANAEGGGGGGSSVRVWHFPDPINNPGQLDVNSLGVTGYGPAPEAVQPSGARGLNTGDARLLYASYQYGHLTTGQTSNCNGRGCAAFYELDVSGYPNMSAVNDWALQNGNLDYFYPAVDQRGNADKTMVYSRSGAGEFAGAVFTGIPNSTVCTLCIDGEVFLSQGQSTYVRICCNNRNRWGDYLSASADPDQTGIWIAGEFVQSQNVWATQVGSTYVGYAPSTSLSSTNVSFGNLRIFNSAQQSVTLTNTGNANLIISFLSLSGTDFSESSSCSGVTLEPFQSCSITIGFFPTAAVFRTGSVSIFDNAAFSPHVISLSGTGIAPFLSLSPGSLGFGTRLLNTTSPGHIVTVTNTGTASSTVSGVTASAQFGSTNNCGVIAVGGTCTVSVTFRPTLTGPITGTLTLFDDATNSPQSISLNGVGTRVKLSATSFTFAGQKVGTTSAAKTLTLTNVGGSPLTIHATKLIGANPADFKVTSACGGSVAPHSSCNIKITFKPTAKGARSATLNINDNGGASPQQIALSGTGT